MPADPSNRERLLRLIDGGADALKEMHTEEPPQEKKLSPTPADLASGGAKRVVHILSGLKKSLPAMSSKDLTRVVLALFIVVGVVAGLHYGSEMLKTVKQQPKAAAAPATEVSNAAAANVLEDESGTGLRLVGVDSSDAAPVALLEDVKTGKTYFAKVNERVKGAQVKKIEKNKVTISVRGKTVELR